MKKITITCFYLSAFFCSVKKIEAQNVGIGTTNPLSRIHLVTGALNDQVNSQGLLIENNNTSNTGEVAVVFKNAGTLGMGNKAWHIGANQNRNFALSYGTAFLNSGTKMLLDSTGSLGLGTLNPDNSALVDLVSVDKGLLLPRLTDTTVVVTPAAGLVMYNQATKSPNYYDGEKWNNLNGSKNIVPLQGSITYSITGTASVGGISIDAGPLAAIDYSNLSFGPRSTNSFKVENADSIIIYKEFDGNSIVLKRAHLGSNVLSVMEISQFQPGAATPFYSVKLTSFRVHSQSYFISETTGKLTEKYGLVAQTVGFKDWVNNKSFSYNFSTLAFGTY